MTAKPLPVFDGHNDLLLRLLHKDKPGVEMDFLDGDGERHMDMPRALKGGFAGGLFAMNAQRPRSESLAGQGGEISSLPAAPEMPYDYALPATMAMAAILFRIEDKSAGRFKVCRSAGEIRQCLDDGVMAAVFHIEGAEAIDADFASLDVLYRAGLRSIGPVWSRPNIFGHGVPFRFPSSPDTGDGLSDLGKELVRRCNAMKIAIDLSHLNEKGFWEVAGISDAPLVASHSNVHAIAPSSRNLTDKQIAAIGSSGGLIGLNYANDFLRPDGRNDPDISFDVMLRHLDHLVDIAGIDCVGLGSDFDGASVPAVIGDVTGLAGFSQAIVEHYGEADARKICYRNWLDVLERTWDG